MTSRQPRSLCFFTLVFCLLTSSSAARGFQIRLVGYGSTECSGRVEIYFRNSWGTVCDDNWDLKDAKVVCRELGCGTAMKATKMAYFGAGSGKIWLDDVDCSGNEGLLSNCQHKEFGQHDCKHNEDAGVVCKSIRLAGFTQCSGRVEIFHNNSWGTVCDDNWDLDDAEVVCRHLKCGSALNAPRSALFGQGSKKIWLDEVACTGSESTLTRCQHGGFGKGDCSHNKDAGVICSASLPKPSISVNPAVKVTWGTNVSINCSNSAELSGGTFILKKTHGRTQGSSSRSGAFSIPNVDFDDEGSYQCHYEKVIFGQTFSSRLSDFIHLSVTVIYPKPSISMSPADEVAWGHNVDVTCSVSTRDLGGTFSLIKTTGSFKKTQTSNASSVTFSIPKVRFYDTGLYKCLYEKRGFKSPLSDFARLSVTVPLPLLFSVSAGILFLLLMTVFLVLCLILRRKRRQAKQAGARISNQLAVTGDDKDNHEYMNFDPGCINKELKEEAGRVEEEMCGDYERPESDEDHDYMEVVRSKSHMIKSQQVCFSVEDNRGDKEDESGYVDVTQSS